MGFYCFAKDSLSWRSEAVVILSVRQLLFPSFLLRWELSIEKLRFRSSNESSQFEGSIGVMLE